MEKSPDAFRTISEVAEALDTPAHVLRFWESRFSQIKPVKRAGGRRYYRPADLALLGGIKHLLHDDGMTIRGVQKLLREQGIRHVAAIGDAAYGDGDGTAAIDAAAAAPLPARSRAAMGPPDNVVPMSAARAAAEAEAEEPQGGAPAPEAVEAPAAPLPAATPSSAPRPAARQPDDAQGDLPFADAAASAESEDTFEWADRTDGAAPTADAPVTGAPVTDASSPDDAAPPAGRARRVLPDLPPEAAEEDPGPTLAARVRALRPAAIGPDLEALATLADRLRGLRHKMAGHARQGHH